MPADPFESFTAAGLYDADHPKASERRELFQHLLDRGFLVEDIIRFGRMPGPITDLAAILANDRHTVFIDAEEVARRCGVDVNEVLDMRAVMGLTDAGWGEPDIPEAFVEDFALFQLGSAAYGKERTMAFARVVGASVAALMEAGRELAMAPLHDANATELEISQANELGMEMWRQVAQLVVHTMREHAGRNKWFEEQILRGEVVMAVAFVDLVGSTQWTLGLSAAEHSRAIVRFEAMAARLSSERGCRVVKFIGDEAMIVGAEAEPVARAAAALCAAVGDDGVLPAARGAVAWGAVQPSGGDYYGDVVNLAARATKEAPAGGIVVTRDVAVKLDPSTWALGPARAVELRGIAGEVELVVAESVA